jgi:hypothetical protein
VVEQLFRKLKTGLFVVLHGFAKCPRSLINAWFAGDLALHGFAPFSGEISTDRREGP